MENVEQEQGYGRIEWFLYIVLLPLLFTVMLAGVLLTFLGYDVVSKVQTVGNQIPLVKNIVPDPKPSTSEGDTVDVQASVDQLETANRHKDAQITELQAELEAQKEEFVQLNAQYEALKTERQDQTQSEEEHLKQIRQLSALYGSMSPSKAAPIIENLTLQEAVLVLSEMPLEQRGKILAKMDPKKAADSSILLKDMVTTRDREIAALQERVKELSQTLSEQQKSTIAGRDLAAIYAEMPPNKAAVILEDLYQKSPTQALTILAAMDRNAMSVVLAEFTPGVASAITSKLLKPADSSQ